MLPRVFASILGPLILLTGACGDDTAQPVPGVASADLRATLTGTSAAAVGVPLTYTVNASNLGPDAAQQVTVRCALSGAFEIVSISDDGQIADDVVSWPTLASLAEEAQVEYMLQVRPTAEGSLSVRAMVDAETKDPVIGNNDGSSGTATVTTQVSFVADLQVASDFPSLADGGATIVVTITTTNHGPSPAEDVLVVDSLPAGVEVISVSNGGSATVGAVNWPAVASLAADDSLVYQFTLVVPAVGPVQSVHLAQSATTDPISANNRGTRRTVITATPILTIDGQIVGEQFGWEIEPIGDLNSDGVADLAISAPYGSGNGSNSGRVYIYSGDGSYIRQFDGMAGDWLGIDMDAETDFTGDGIPELIVGAPTATGVNSPGSVYIYSLADGATIRVLTGENPGDRFGWSAAGAGDVNNDGSPDLYVGARDHSVAGTKSGRAYLYSGADWSRLLTVDGTSAGDQFGQAGGGVGDLDADGFDDFAVGAPDYSVSANPGRGRVYVVSGATGEDLFAPIEPDGTAINLGSFWVFSPGDLNGDGVPDIFASDINNNALGGSTGRAYVFSGTDGSAILTLTGESAGDQFGIGHPAGDLDGDGVTDLSIAAWLSSEGGNQAGKVYLVAGATGEVFRTITSTISGENFGFDAFVIGDVNGDGIPDLAVSGGISASTTGYVKLYAGLAP